MTDEWPPCTNEKYDRLDVLHLYQLYFNPECYIEASPIGAELIVAVHLLFGFPSSQKFTISEEKLISVPEIASLCNEKERQQAGGGCRLKPEMGLVCPPRGSGYFRHASSH